MKTELTTAEWAHIYEFVLDVVEIIRYDDTGITNDLVDRAVTVAEILDININDDTVSE